MAKSSTTAKPPPTAHDGAAKLDAAAQAIAPGDVGKLPNYAKRRLDHLDRLAAAAARDADALRKVPLEDGALQASELELLPVALKAASALGDDVGADRLAAGTALSAADQKLLGGVRADQKLVIGAFRRLRFKGRSAELKRLRAIEAGEADDVVDARNDSAALVALAGHDDHRAWVASLPRGEGDAVARLKAAHPRIEALATASQGDTSAAGRRDRLRRVWTVVSRIERRVRAAGAYLFHGKPQSADYRAFKAPVTRKKKSKT